MRRALHKPEGTSQQLQYPGARAPSNFTASGTSSSVSCDGCGVVHAEKLRAIWSKKKVRHLTVWCHMEISGALNNNCTCMLFTSHILGLCWPFPSCAWGSAPLLHCYQILKLFDGRVGRVYHPIRFVGVFLCFNLEVFFSARFWSKICFQFLEGILEPEGNKKSLQTPKEMVPLNKGSLVCKLPF